MTKPAHLWTLSACELAPLLARGDVRPDDLLEACLARIAHTQPLVNAMAHVATDAARLAAAASRQRQQRGQRLGPIDGIPVTVKDNLFVAGMPATWGSRLYERFVPDVDDIAVERLRAGGAVIVGKTNTPEFALAGRTDNRLFGLTRNPWDLRLNPGGSSGGAVAGVASGGTPLALATDAGGSGRLPAAYTGVVGMRPSNGAVARCHGFPALAPDFQVIAPIARTAGDLALLLHSIQGSDRRDPLSCRYARHGQLKPPGQTRIGVALHIGPGEGGRAEGEPVDPEVRAHVRAASETMRSLGYQVHDCAVPFHLEQVRALWRTLAAAGVARTVQAFPGWEDQVTDGIAAMARHGIGLRATDHVRALDALAALRARVSTAWQGFDVLLTPTSAAPTFPIEQMHPQTIAGVPADTQSMSIFTTWVNACGLPALSLPVEPAADGRPIGMQLVGQFGADDTLLDMAARFEAAQPWATRRPPLDTPTVDI